MFIVMLRNKDFLSASDLKVRAQVGRVSPRSKKIPYLLVDINDLKEVGSRIHNLQMYNVFANLNFNFNDIVFVEVLPLKSLFSKEINKFKIINIISNPSLLTSAQDAFIAFIDKQNKERETRYKTEEKIRQDAFEALSPEEAYDSLYDESVIVVEDSYLNINGENYIVAENDDDLLISTYNLKKVSGTSDERIVHYEKIEPNKKAYLYMYKDEVSQTLYVY